MDKYKIKIDRSQKGVKLDSREEIITSKKIPKVGESISFLVEPPIIETIVSVKKMKH